MTQLAHWLALHFTPKFGPSRIVTCYEQAQDLQALYHLSAQQRQQLGLPQSLTPLDDPKVRQSLAWAEQPNQTILTWDHPDYPRLLREIPAAPVVLFIKGNPAVLQTQQIAIIGSRNPSPQGVENAQLFTDALIDAGFVITSGLARGIDGVAHHSCIQKHAPTIAVLGTGLNKIYPARHQALAEWIVGEAGALVSEFPLDTPPLARNFPQRNRIISGLSMGVLVIEAAERSGSLITARYALEQGREVYAIPGSIHNPLAKGCHKLLREGASLVETITDITNEIKGLTAMAPPIKPGTLDLALDSCQQNLVNCIGFEPTSVDNLAQRCGLDAPTILATLTELELSGIIRTVPGGVMRNKS